MDARDHERWWDARIEAALEHNPGPFTVDGPRPAVARVLAMGPETPLAHRAVLLVMAMHHPRPVDDLDLIVWAEWLMGDDVDADPLEPALELVPPVVGNRAARRAKRRGR